LPNLETKFVAANTLIGINRQGGFLRVNEVVEKEKDLAIVRHKHFLARTPETKIKYRKKDDELRHQIAKLLKKVGWDDKTATMLAEWNPYDQNISANFFDTEWMFGLLQGFDIVVGNPPYVLVQNLNIKEEIKQVYNSYLVSQYKTDLYHLFIQKSIELLKNDTGFLTFITPNTFLKNKHNNKLRKFIFDKTQGLSFVLFYTQVFDNASVDNLIFVFSKKKNKDRKTRIIEVKSNNFDVDISHNIQEFDFSQIKGPDFIFNFGKSSDSNSIINKIEENSWCIKDIGRSYFGIQTFDRKIYVSNEKLNQFYVPIIDGENVKKYYISDSREYVDFRKESIKSGGNPEVYKIDRIVVRQIGEFPSGSICKANLYTLNTIYNIFLNKSGISLKYVLSVINSRLTEFFWRSLYYDNKATFPKIKKDALESIRIKKINEKQQKTFITLVDQILFAKIENPEVDTLSWESEINARVFKLNDFSEEEILQVLNSLPNISEIEKTEILKQWHKLNDKN